MALSSSLYEDARSDLGEWKRLLARVYKDTQNPKAMKQLSSVLSQAADLLEKYNTVLSRGGWLRVTGLTAWRELQQQFEFCQNLRAQYEEMLFCVEKSVHPATLFSITYDMFDLEPSNIKEAVNVNPPVSGVADTSYWKSAIIAGFSVFRGFSSVVFGLRPNLFQVAELSRFSKQVVVNQLEAPEKNRRQLSLSSYESWDEIESRLKNSGSEMFNVELDLELYESAYAELANKVPKSLFCCSDSDCLRYLDWKVEGLNSPKLLLMNNSSAFIQDLAFLCLSKVLFCLGRGSVEIWGLDLAFLPRIRERVKEKYGCSLSDWLPSDEFFLSFNIPAHYLILNEGDFAILQSQKVYWIKAERSCHLAYWNFLPYTLEAFESAIEVYKDNQQTAQPNAIPLYTLMITLLSQEVSTMSEDLRIYCIQQVHSHLSNELFLNEQAVVRPSEDHFCEKCSCELLCSYILCTECQSKDLCKDCFEDPEDHKCNVDPICYLKFDEQLFIELLENQTDTSKNYDALKLLHGNARASSEDLMVISSEKQAQLASIKAPVLEGLIEVQLRKKKLRSSSSSSSQAPEGMLFVGDPDFKLHPHKQKIKDAIENPLTGPRFTYELDNMGRGMQSHEQKKDLKAELAGLIFKHEPKYFAPKTSDLDQVQKNLSILVRNSTREELLKKKTTGGSQKLSTKMQFAEDELKFEIPRKKHKS
mmetsp:Transcript_1962/g.4365  ORF Transcript_1962/g.4365 Transcript_1962/m.4365 type:complete len:701 (-) Transcript_1962:1920-4022(-)